MSEKVKHHKNKNGKWTVCSASQRACRYASATPHQYFVAGETPTDKKQPEVVASAVKPQITIHSVAENVDEPDTEEWGKTFTVTPDKVEAFINEINKANRRLERSGITDRFTYTTEDTVVSDPDNGINYQAVKFVLNKPRISLNGWDFMGTVDHYINEDGEQVVTTYGAGDKPLDTGFESDDAVKCDHCGYRRSRNKTYVVKNKEGEYKQVGSNCLAAFLGVKPKGLWALENPLVDEETHRAKYGTLSAGANRFMLLETRNVVALGLALTRGGSNYIPASHSHSTKQEVVNRILGVGENKNEVDIAPHLEEADKMIKDSVFDSDEDYGRNMKTLLAQNSIPFSKVGYVVSVIPYYLRQQTVRKEAPPKAKGFIGEKGEKITGINDAKVEIVQSYQSNYGYNSVDGLFMVLRTPDNKLIQWSTTSRDERLERIKKGTIIDLNQVTVKGQDTWKDEDQTAVKSVKFSLVEGYDEAPSYSD